MVKRGQKVSIMVHEGRREAVQGDQGISGNRAEEGIKMSSLLKE